MEDAESPDQSGKSPTGVNSTDTRSPKGTQSTANSQRYTGRRRLPVAHRLFQLARSCHLRLFQAAERLL
jgi:hypothetical protein